MFYKVLLRRDPTAELERGRFDRAAPTLPVDVERVCGRAEKVAEVFPLTKYPRPLNRCFEVGPRSAGIPLTVLESADGDSWAPCRTDPR